ncbi:hypothetical protein KIPB_012815, partial [Kipferlia bialata]|eukprot:g12815.t1
MDSYGYLSIHTLVNAGTPDVCVSNHTVPGRGRGRSISDMRHCVQGGVLYSIVDGTRVEALSLDTYESMTVPQPIVQSGNLGMLFTLGDHVVALQDMYRPSGIRTFVYSPDESEKGWVDRGFSPIPLRIRDIAVCHGKAYAYTRACLWCFDLTSGWTSLGASRPDSICIYSRTQLLTVGRCVLFCPTTVKDDDAYHIHAYDTITGTWHDRGTVGVDEYCVWGLFSPSNVLCSRADDGSTMLRDLDPVRRAESIRPLPSTMSLEAEGMERTRQLVKEDSGSTGVRESEIAGESEGERHPQPDQEREDLSLDGDQGSDMDYSIDHSEP